MAGGPLWGGRDLEENGVLPLQTPHFQLPGPKEAQSSLWSERGRGRDRCAQKGTSTWVTHSQCHRQIAIPHSYQKSPPAPNTHPAVYHRCITVTHKATGSHYTHAQHYKHATATPKVPEVTHTCVCMYTHMWRQRVTETENHGKSQVSDSHTSSHGKV